MTLYLTNFRLQRPRYEYTQDVILDWLSAAHAQAESLRQKETMPTFDAKEFRRQMHLMLSRLGQGQGKVKIRGTHLADIGHTDWSEMELVRLTDLAKPACIGEKTAFFGKEIDIVFEKFYPVEEPLPEELIHVTCTGYLSPSGAQKLIAKRKAGRKTTVTHAYHMGCYAAIPALRIARGLVCANKKRADIVHTELCSLHLDPHSHTPEQLVIQSLFGDGSIRYSLSKQTSSSSSIAILALRETILSDTFDAMTWQPASWGMQMSLKKEVPRLIADAIGEALDDLAEEAELDRTFLQETSIFAIHPGGPKIIETVASMLNLTPNQYEHSYTILERYGNMSSATLPHIWDSLLKDTQVSHDTHIVSLGFGPGLTVASSLMKKVCS